jgi:hypothetical protein
MHKLHWDDYKSWIGKDSYVCISQTLLNKTEKILKIYELGLLNSTRISNPGSHEYNERQILKRISWTQNLAAPAQILVEVTWNLLRALFCLSMDHVLRAGSCSCLLFCWLAGCMAAMVLLGLTPCEPSLSSCTPLKLLEARESFDRKKEVCVVDTRTKNWGGILRHICPNYLSAILPASYLSPIVISLLGGRLTNCCCFIMTGHDDLRDK